MYADINRGFLLDDDCDLFAVRNGSRNTRDRHLICGLPSEWIPL